MNNYIDCSQYFKAVSFVSISPYVSSPIGGSGSSGILTYPTIPFHQNIIGTDVLIWAMSYETSVWKIRHWESKINRECSSCQAVIYGLLK